MTKLTKNEKILRKSNEKWKNFLAEGAFKKTINEFDEDDAYHFDQDKSDSEPLPPEAKSATYWVKKGDKVRIYGLASKKGPQPPEEYKCKYGIVKGFSKENDREVIVQFDDGKVLSLDHSVMSKNPGTWKMDFFYPDCEDNLSEARMGEYGKMDAEQGLPPTKIGRGNEEYMAAYNAVLQARGEEPLDIQKPDQAYLDALRSGQLEEASGARTAEAVNQIEAILNGLYDDGVDNATLITLLKQIIVDIGRGYVGQPSESKIQENEKKTFKVGEFVRIVAGSLKGATGKVIEPITTSKGEQGYVIELYSSAKMKVFGGPGDEVIATADEMESGGTTDGMELYDIDEKKNLKEEVIEDFEIELEDGITFADVEEAGLVTPGVDSVIDNGDGYAQVYSEPGAMAKMAKTLEAMTGVMVTPKSHGAVDERSKDDERDLEKPVKYGSGAELEFDKKAQKFYDRKRDMYIDDKEEEDNLIKEKDEKEFAKIFARAEDMLVLSARSRVPVTLKSVQSALDVIKIPSEMEKGKLIVKNEYVIADKNELPETAKQISFTKYAMDYLSNLPGEQLDLPMEEQERPDFVTSYSADPHLDQIEDYALTVVEKGGNLRQLEDVLNRDGFATFLKGDVLTIDDEFFVGNEENFDISPGEDVRRIKGSNLVVGRIT
tara:strand:- start:1505 stop:3487 length:1983 start_codon:yes stop_codon:yes gene_type:complete